MLLAWFAALGAAQAVHAAHPDPLDALRRVPGPSAQAELGDAPAGADDPYANARAFIEVQVDRREWWLGQSIVVRLRIGIQEAFRSELLPLFRRNLGLPVQIQAPWIESREPGSSAASMQGSSTRVDETSRVTCALGASVVSLSCAPDTSRDGRAFRVYELVHTLRPDRPGPISLAGTALRLSYATEYAEGAFTGRIPRNPTVALVSGADVDIEVVALPEQGRLAAFGGAIGNFSIRAELDRNTARVGESVRLTLHIEGTGNFGAFGSPRLPDDPRFAVRATRESIAEAGLRVEYEMAVRAPGNEVFPSVEFPYFDPRPADGGAARYALAKSAALPVEVLAAHMEPAPPRPQRVVPRTTPAPSDRPDKDARPPLGVWIGGGLGLAVLVFGILRAVRGSATGAGPSRPGPPRSREALGLLRAGLEQEDAEVGQLLCTYLGTQLDCSPPAIIGPGLTDRLLGAGTPRELAHRLTTELEAWVASRYGGSTPAHGKTGLLGLIEEVERSWGLHPR